MLHKLKITLCRKKTNFHLLLQNKDFNKLLQKEFHIFGELFLFSLVSNKVVILSWYYIILEYGEGFRLKLHPGDQVYCQAY